MAFIHLFPDLSHSACPIKIAWWRWLGIWLVRVVRRHSNPNYSCGGASFLISFFCFLMLKRRGQSHRLGIVREKQFSSNELIVLFFHYWWWKHAMVFSYGVQHSCICWKLLKRDTNQLSLSEVKTLNKTTLNIFFIWIKICTKWKHNTWPLW